MKIRISAKDFKYRDLKYYIVNEYPRVRFWEVNNHILLAEKNPFTAAYIFIGKKSITVIGAFPKLKNNLLALIVMALGGVVIPLAIYFLLFRRAHKRFATSIAETIAKKFSVVPLLNKTSNAE